MITAANCVCNFYDTTQNAARYCLPNDPGSNANQQTPDEPYRPLNYVKLRVGNRKWKDAEEKYVKEAYVMDTESKHNGVTGNPVIRNAVDIGMLITNESMNIARRLVLPRLE